MKTVILHNHPIHYKHLLFQEMVRLGVDFTVLFGGTKSNIRNEDVSLSQHLYKYRFLFDGPLEGAPVLRRVVATFRALRELRPNLIISGGYERPECWAAWFWAFLFGVPVVLWYESNRFDWPRHWWKELPKRVFMMGLAGAHVYGWTNREYLIHLGLDANSILIKRAVVDVSRFDLPASQKDYRPNGKTRLLYVGRFAPEKNVSFLIEAFARANELVPQQLELILVGGGTEEASLRAQVSSLHLDELVTVTGYVPQAKLMPCLQAADVFVLPSTREPWGLVALEAMLSRMPVLISTQCGCAADLISPKSGWSFSPWKLEELTARLAQLPLMTTSELRSMGDFAHSVAVEYSPQKSAKAIVDSIRGLPNNSNRIAVNFKPEPSRL